ncbi:hypothetical protein OJAV_G00014880 [Oryzias javanicus]|uniref:Insulin-like growth factor-binding protein 5 n=1 Tax=Oryzias javanicus TaxID=123683 RepID=A0A437DK64_ORYJA|nr:hypothetical protein OJAV_G00014880 [Oryzias javanicus]
MQLCVSLLLLLPLLRAPGCASSFVPCEQCDARAVSKCPPPPQGCQLVREPGCGCCLTCALEEGHACGVYTRPCMQGLRCLPKNGEEKPLHALLHGRGTCMNEKLYKLLQMHQSKESVQTKVPIYGDISSRKAQALKHAMDRKGQSSRKGLATNRSPSSPRLEKLEPEFGPCRRRLDSLLRSMKDTSQVVALSLYVPNCDKKGYFKRKQCKPSRGRKRGICWCVDPLGVRIPSISNGGGELQCREIDNNSNGNE